MPKPTIWSHGKLPEMRHGNIRDLQLQRKMAPVKKDKLETAKHDRRDQTDKKTWKRIAWARKTDTKRSLQISKKKLKPPTRNWVKAKKTDETKNSSTSKKCKNWNGSKRSRWIILWDRGEKRRGDGKRSRWRTSWTSHTSKRGGRFYRVACRKRRGREREDCRLEWSSLPWRYDRDRAQTRRSECRTDWKRYRNRMLEDRETTTWRWEK